MIRRTSQLKNFHDTPLPLHQNRDNLTWNYNVDTYCEISFKTLADADNGLQMKKCLLF